MPDLLVNLLKLPALESGVVGFAGYECRRRGELGIYTDLLKSKQ